MKRKESIFNYLIFPNPAHDNKNELKLAHLAKVDDNWFLGSGIYLSNISASFDQKEKDQLVAYVNEALQFAKENGKQKSLAVFNDPKGNFTKDGRYIFALDYKGQILAQPDETEQIGTNGIDAQDPNGVYETQQTINAAKMGNGFLYYIDANPYRNMTLTLKLSYVANVDDTWLLGSGIYANGEDTPD